MPLTTEQLAWPIEGVGLTAASLGDELGSGRTLLVFLRHSG